MTDKEIFETEIKCINRRANGKCNGGTDCCKCDLLMNEKDIISAYERAIANSNLINRQQAEIERLTKETMNMAATIETCQSEAIKEFAESLNDRIINFPSVYPVENATLAFLNGSSHRQLEILEIINNLVKEMVAE